MFEFDLHAMSSSYVPVSSFFINRLLVSKPRLSTLKTTAKSHLLKGQANVNAKILKQSNTKFWLWFVHFISYHGEFLPGDRCQLPRRFLFPIIRHARCIL